jgi:hypothetical protein
LNRGASPPRLDDFSVWRNDQRISDEAPKQSFYRPFPEPQEKIRGHKEQNAKNIKNLES